MTEPMTDEAATRLRSVTTATLTTVLLKRGLRNVWLRGAFPLAPDQPRVVGPAFTLRFVPAREDLATPAAWASPTSTRAAIEAMPEGAVAVVDAMGVTDAGIFGDILCARMATRGVAAPRHRRRRPRPRRRARHRPAGLGPRHRRAAVGRRPHLRRLAAARRLRRRRDLPRRPDRRRPRRRRRRSRRRSPPRSPRPPPSRSARRPGSWPRSPAAPRCPASTRWTAATRARYEADRAR